MNLIIGLFLFLGVTTSKAQEYVFLNPVDTTYTLEYWDSHYLVKIYDEWESMVKELTGYYERENYILDKEEELKEKTKVLDIQEQMNDLLITNTKLIITQLDTCEALYEEADNTINDLKKNLKSSNNNKSIWKTISITAILYILISLI